MYTSGDSPQRVSKSLRLRSARNSSKRLIFAPPSGCGLPACAIGRIREQPTRPEKSFPTHYTVTSLPNNLILSAASIDRLRSLSKCRSSKARTYTVLQYPQATRFAIVTQTTASSSRVFLRPALQQFPTHYTLIQTLLCSQRR